MRSVQTRLARVDDAAVACTVLRRSISELCKADHKDDPAMLASWLANKTSENVAAWISNPDNVVYVAVETGGKIVGVAAMTCSGSITLNYVSPDVRFKGVSKALLAQLESRAVELGVKQCRLESTMTALSFYRAAGYREEPGKESGACGSPCRSMLKDLSPSPAELTKRGAATLD